MTTPRLQLSLFSLADAKELRELFSDPLTATIGSGPFTSISQTQQWISKRVFYAIDLRREAEPG